MKYSTIKGRAVISSKYSTKENHTRCALDYCELLQKSMLTTEELSVILNESKGIIEKVRSFDSLPSTILQNKIEENMEKLWKVKKFWTNLKSLG